MGQVTIYLDNETETKLKKAAKYSQTSVSKWIGNMIKEHIKNEWPQEIANLAGTWKNDFPSLNEIRNIKAQDIKREEL